MDWSRGRIVGLLLLSVYALVWLFLAIEPLSRSDWILENLLVWITLPLVVVFHDRLRISIASDLMLFVFYTLHAIGGHWSYSNVPFIPWEQWGFERNHFDRIVHFSFGLLLWLPLRDVLARMAHLGPRWSGVFALTMIWALSGVYEVIEWGAVAVVSPELGQEFLGAQGDEFDASKDMALAMGGAALAFVIERVVARFAMVETGPPQAIVRAVPSNVPTAKPVVAKTQAPPGTMKR